MNQLQHMQFADLFPKWKNKQYSEEAIILELQHHGIQDETHISDIIRHYKRHCCQDRQKTGFILTAIGSFLGFMSCVFSMLDLIPDLRGFFLYGLTSIGITVAFIGLYLIFEE